MILGELFDIAVDLVLEPVYRMLERGARWTWRTARSGIRRLLQRGPTDG